MTLLRRFIGFVNQQGRRYRNLPLRLSGDKVRIEHQVARVMRPTSQRIENGHPVIVWASLEDPSPIRRLVL